MKITSFLSPFLLAFLSSSLHFFMLEHRRITTVRKLPKETHQITILCAHPGLLEPFLNIRDEIDIKSFPNIGTEAAVRRQGQYGS